MDYLGEIESLCLPKDTDSITFHLQEYFKYFTVTLSINITAILHLVFYITGCPFGYKYKKKLLGVDSTGLSCASHSFSHEYFLKAQCDY